MKYDWSILHETAHWLAINKPSSLNVEPIWDYSNVQDQVIDYLRQATGRQNPYVGIVHRLDRPVSGVLLLAKKKSTLRSLNEQFAQRKVSKTYWAVCADSPPAEQAKIEHHLIKEQKNKRSVVFSTPRKGSTPVSLSYCLMAQKEGRYLLQVHPHSGKFHQIRVQLAAIGCPIVGDHKYGSTVQDAPDCIALHGRELEFFDPQAADQKKKYLAPVPTRKAWNISKQTKQ